VKRKVACGFLIFAALVGLACSDPDRLASAEAALQSGRTAEALETLKELLKSSPDDPDANRLYGIALMKSGRPELAVWSLQKAYDLTHQDAGTGLWLARALQGSGDVYDAVVVADEVLEKDPELIEARAVRATANLAAMRREEALEDLDWLIELEPDSIEYRLDRVAALIGLRRLDEAEASIAEVQALADERADNGSGGTSINGARVDREGVQLCLLASVFAQERGNVEEAESSFNACLERYPHDYSLLAQASPLLDQLGKASQVNDFIAAAAQAEPGSAQHQSLWSARLLALGRADEAEQVLIDLAEENETPQALNALLQLYSQSKQYAKTIETIRRIIRSQAEHGVEPLPMQLFIIADLLIENGELEQAREENQALEPPLSDFIEGKVLMKLGQNDQALKVLGRGLMGWPDNAVGRFLAGQAAEQVGDFERAEEEYQAGVRAGPGLSPSAVALAQLYVALGQTQRAVVPLNLYLNESAGDLEAMQLRMRLAAEFGEDDVFNSILKRLGQRKATQGYAAARYADHMAKSAGPRQAADSLNALKIDFGDKANAEAVLAWATHMADAEALQLGLDRIEDELLRAGDAGHLYEAKALLLNRSGAPAAMELKAAKEATRGDQGRPEARLALARAHARAGDRAEALRIHRIAAESEEGGEDERWALYEFLVAGGEGRSLGARTQLEAILAAEPKHGRAALALSALMLEEGSDDLDRTLDLARRARRFEPGPSSSAVLIRTLLLRNQPNRAVAVAERATEQWPDFPSTWFWQSNALLAAGKNAPASASLEKVLEFGETQFSEQARKMRQNSLLSPAALTPSPN
jgi:predicted Zn-dependent protease